MHHVLDRLATGGFELNCRVLHVEVLDEACTHLVEHTGRIRAGRITTCPKTMLMPDVSVQACRSWMSSTSSAGTGCCRSLNFQIPVKRGAPSASRPRARPSP